MHQRRTSLALAFASIAAATPAAAQDILVPPTPQKGIWMDASYSDFKESLVSFPSSVWYVSGRLPVSDRVSARFDLPFAYARMEFEGASESSSVIGNPYVGVELAASDQLGVELGGRLPLTTADEESFADVIAAISDPMRIEAFAEDLVPVSAAATYTRALSPAFSLRARGGATEFFDTGDSAEGSETSLDYGLAGTYTSGGARLGLGLAGRWLASADEGDFGENSFHAASASADVLVRGVRPGVTLRMPLDSEFRDLVNATVGVYLQVPLR